VALNHDSYAMAYCKYGKKPAIGCSVVLNNGTLPIKSINAFVMKDYGAVKVFLMYLLLILIVILLSL
jgi:hypothetical protein